jgi:hypothetical protein
MKLKMGRMAEHKTTLLKERKTRIEVNGGKTIKAEMRRVPINRIPSTTVSAVIIANTVS